MFLVNFDGGYNDSTWSTNWGIEYVDRANGGRLIKSDLNNGMALRVEYPEGGIGPKESGVSFPIVFRNISNVEQGLFNELYIRYYVKFEKGFDFRLGGKLPGIMGGGDSWTRSGGQQPDGSNGWTLRFMWREGGEIVIYAYLPKSQNGKWGRKEWGQDITTGVYSTPGQWYCIEQYVNIGTPGKDDGVLKVWMNNELKIFIDDLRFWNVENNFGKIGGIYFSTFHGKITNVRFTRLRIEPGRLILH